MAEQPGRIKACTECRQQKVRCDAYKDYTKPCSRCKAYGFHCVISRVFRRRKKQTKSELLHELARLKQSVNTPAPISIESSLCQDTALETTYTNPNTETGFPTSSAQVQNIPNIYVSGHPAMNTLTKEKPVPIAGLSPPQITATSHQYSEGICRGNNNTLDRTLYDVNVTGGKIDDCYALFNKHYVPMIPGIFDLSISPNRRFQQSPFLFWVMVYTGARRYSRDPTIYERLSKRIIDFAFSSLSCTAQAVPIIQALLILCTWPVPMSSLYKDHSHALSGAGMHMAIQNGLHMFCLEEDFAIQPSKRRTDSRPLLVSQLLSSTQWSYSDTEIRFRACLWFHCLIVFQNTSILDGLPVPVMPVGKSVDLDAAVYPLIPETLFYHYKLHKIQIEAINTIGKCICLENSEADATLHSFIEIFDTRIQEVGDGSLDANACLVKSCSRLLVRAFHFFAFSTCLNQIGLMQLYMIALDIIDNTWKLDQTQDFARYMSKYFARTVLLAAYCILRLKKSELGNKLPNEEAEEAFFKVVDIVKKRSLQGNDLDSLSAKMLTQLWSSKKIFKEDSGPQTGLHLDLRDRLSMSVIFDCFWWWRTEFGGLSENTQSVHKPKSPWRMRAVRPAFSDMMPCTLPDGPSQSVNETVNEPIYFSDGEMNLPSNYFFGYPDWNWAATLQETMTVNPQVSQFTTG